MGVDGVSVRCVAALLAGAPLGCALDPNGDASQGSTGEPVAASSSTTASTEPQTDSTTGGGGSTAGAIEPDESATGSTSTTDASSGTTTGDAPTTGDASTTTDASTGSTSTGVGLDPPSCEFDDASTPDCTPWLFTPDPAWTLDSMHAHPSGGVVLGGSTTGGAVLVGLDPEGAVEWAHVVDPTEHGFAEGAASVGGLATLASGDVVARIDREGQAALLIRLVPSDGTLAWAHEFDDEFLGLPWGVSSDLYEPPTVSSDVRVAASMTSSALVVSVSGAGGFPPAPPPRLIVRLDPATGLPLWVQQHGAYNAGLTIDDAQGRVLSEHQQSTGFTMSHIAAHHLDGALEATLSSAQFGGGLGLSGVDVRSDGGLVSAFYLDFSFQPTHLGVWDEALELEDAHVVAGVFPVDVAVDTLDVAHVLLGAPSPCDPLLLGLPPGGVPEVELLRGEDWPTTRSLSTNETAIRLLHVGGEVRQVCLPA